MALQQSKIMAVKTISMNDACINRPTLDLEGTAEVASKTPPTLI
jgi:hypothetical protein